MHATTETGEVLLDRTDDGVAIVTLNRPHTLNAVTPTLAREFAATLRALDADETVGAIVVTGAGRGFCSGADLGLLGGDLDVLRAAVPARADLPGPHLAPRTPVVALCHHCCCSKKPWWITLNGHCCQAGASKRRSCSNGSMHVGQPWALAACAT